MAHLAVWHGSEAEILRLLEAVEHNCECARGPRGEVRRPCCAAHQMLALDQRALDGLLFARWLAARLQDEEWDGCVTEHPTQTPTVLSVTPVREKPRVLSLMR